MRLPTCSVRCPATQNSIVLCTAPPWAWPPVPFTAPQYTYPRAVYGLAVQSARLVARSALPGTCQPVPCAGPTHTFLLSVTRPLRERLRSLRARLRRTRTGRVLVQPRRANALARCTARGSPHVPCSSRDARPGPIRAWPRRPRTLQFRVRPRSALCTRSVYGPATES